MNTVRWTSLLVVYNIEYVLPFANFDANLRSLPSGFVCVPFQFIFFASLLLNIFLLEMVDVYNRMLRRLSSASSPVSILFFAVHKINPFPSKFIIIIGKKNGDLYKLLVG